METTLEVLTTRRSRWEAHRQWPDEMKARTRVGELPPVTIRLEESAFVAQVAVIARALAAAI
jgi:hypothetical protein